MDKKLQISATDKKLAGVCGGLAEYFGKDATIIRLIAVIITLITGGTGILAYLILWLIMSPSKEI